MLQFFLNVRLQRIQTKPMLPHFILSLLRDVRPVVDLIRVEVHRISLQHADDGFLGVDLGMPISV